MKLIKIDEENYINPEQIVCINLPSNPEYAQYWLTIVLESKIKVSLHFNTQEEGERFIKDLVRTANARKVGE
nr:MAG TPA: hypothetical protein [Caudoviricetes sp.]